MLMPMPMFDPDNQSTNSLSPNYYSSQTSQNLESLPMLDPNNQNSNNLSSDYYGNRASQNFQSLGNIVFDSTIDYLTDGLYTVGKAIWELGSAVGNLEMANRLLIAEQAAKAHKTTTGYEFQQLCDNGAGPFDDYMP